jgi:GNAT superfamily N-acetyltransferase
VEKVRAQLEDPANAAWLAEAGGRAVGHALAGACALSHPEVTAACGELKRLYVLSGWRGGLGSRLLATALAWLEDQGRSRVWLGVWSGNLGAVRLYRKMGFEQVGHYQFRVGAARDHELILRRG